MHQYDQLTKLSQNLRKNATREENSLWYRFLRHYPVQFRRQCVLGQYIVDFYCAKALLVIELDGSQHYGSEGIEKDAIRTQFLESLGLKVLRFSNADVNTAFARVCEAIDLCVKQRYSDGPIPAGMGRKSSATIQNLRAITPHPPPAGAPSPRGKGFGFAA